MVTPEDKAALLEIITGAQDNNLKMEIVVVLLLRYLKAKDISVVIDPDIDVGTITLRF